LRWLERTRHRLACEYVVAGLLGWQARRCFRRLRTAAVSVQARFRGNLGRQAVRDYAAAKASAEAKAALLSSAVLLQRWWRRKAKAQEAQEVFKPQRPRAWVPPSSLPTAQTVRSPVGAPQAGTLRRSDGELRSDRALRQIRAHRPPISYGGEFARRSGSQRPAGIFRDKENEAPPGHSSAADKKAWLPPVPQIGAVRSSEKGGSPTSRRQGEPARSAPRETLQAQLRCVGRVLREKDLPPEKAELLQGALETVMSYAGTSTKLRKGSPQRPPPWRSPGRNEGWTQPKSPPRARKVPVARSSPGRSPPGVTGSLAALEPVLRQTSPRRNLSWTAPDGFFGPDKDAGEGSQQEAKSASGSRQALGECTNYMNVCNNSMHRSRELCK